MRSRTLVALAAAPALVALATGLASCGREAVVEPRASAPDPAPAASSKPQGRAAPVVVAIVVDQFSAWVAEERVPLLPKDGFFARLVREGTWARTMRYPYAITDTGPGHAALHTGKVPAETHIVINELPDDKTGKRTSFFRDPATRLVGPDGVVDVPGSSAARLAAPTVADALRAAHPAARVVSISLKDRAALLPAGKKPNAAIWFDTARGSFVTSTAVSETFPAWARPLGDTRAMTALRARTWEPLDRAWLTEHAGRDDAPGEGDLDGLGVTFPHRAPTWTALKATPMSDERILELALAAVSAERDPDEPFLLLLSMSTSDVVGHTFGPSSWEAWDQLRRLDASLASFLTTLESRVGAVSVLLSGDHGTVTMPEARAPLPRECSDGARKPDKYDRPLCRIGGRLEPFEITAELRAEAKKVVGRDDTIMGVCDGYVFLSSAGRALPAPARASLDAAIRRVFSERHANDVDLVLDVRDLATRCPSVLAGARPIPDRARPGEDLTTLVCRSWTGDVGAGDYYIVPKHGSFFDGEVVAGKGTSHGTPWLYDRTVPFFVRSAAGGVDAGSVIDDPIDFTAYAEIERALLGLDPRAPREILDALRAR